jgi:hypothetical protein
MGPKQPDEAKAVHLVQAREAVEALPRPEGSNGERRAYRREVDRVIREAMGRPRPTAYQECCRWFDKLTPQEKERFLAEKNQEGW